MSTQMSALAAILALLAIGATASAQDHLTPEQQAAARAALAAWFDCTECTNGELKTLVALGPAVESALITTLNDGLSPAKRAEVEQQLRYAYKTSGVHSMSEEQYVRTYLSNKKARYRIRAATALGQLRTADAVIALRRAAENSSLRADVRAAAERALQAPP